MPTSVSLFNQGLTQILEAAVSGLDAQESYMLAFSGNAVGPIRQSVIATTVLPQRYLVVAKGSIDHIGEVLQVQAPSTNL